MPADSFAVRAREPGRTCGACGGWRGPPDGIIGPRPDRRRSPGDRGMSREDRSFLIALIVIGVLYLAVKLAQIAGYLSVESL
jgi:hypothetical protein